MTFPPPSSLLSGVYFCHHRDKTHVHSHWAAIPDSWFEDTFLLLSRNPPPMQFGLSLPHLYVSPSTSEVTARDFCQRQRFILLFSKYCQWLMWWGAPSPSEIWASTVLLCHHQYLPFYFKLYFFEIGWLLIYYVAKDDLKRQLFLPPYPKCRRLQASATVPGLCYAGESNPWLSAC